MSFTINYRHAIVITGGGTGGHFFPGVALAERIQERFPDHPLVFVGAERGIESRILPNLKWPFALFPVEGFIGRSPLGMLQAAWWLWWSEQKLKRLWKVDRPSCVVGTGGYASAPALRAAQSLKIPFCIHESNASPGRLVQWLAPHAVHVWCGLKDLSAKLPKAKCKVVGTPLRQSFVRSFQEIKLLKPPYQLLVLGGSGGAQAINKAMLIAGPALLEQFPDWTILHQVGIRDFAFMQQQVRHERYRIVAFIDAMDLALEESSLVISRSGASICAELKASGRGSILIPFPKSAGDHQRHNAEALAKENRAILVLEQENLHDFIEAHAASHMAKPYPRITLAKTPESNHAVELCLNDLELILNSSH